MTNRQSLAFIRAKVDEARPKGHAILAIHAPKAVHRVLRREYPGVMLIVDGERTRVVVFEPSSDRLVPSRRIENVEDLSSKGLEF